MTARVQIQIEAQDASSGVLRAITSQFGALGGAVSDMADMFGKNNALMDLYNRGLNDMSVSAEEVARAEEAANAATARFAETVARLAIDQMKAAIEETAKYAEEVHALTLASGASYEEASRLLQVLGDYNITAGDVTTATRKMTENGFAPTVDTLAQLSDRYNSLNTAQEKNQFLIENLGRGGAEWAKVLALGSDAIMELNDGVSENLILNREAYESAEKYRLAVDELEDSWTGLKTSFGSAAFEPLANIFLLISENIDKSTKSTGSFLSNAIPLVGIIRSIGSATELYNEKQLEAMESGEGMKELNSGLADSFTAVGESVAAVDYESLIDSMIDYQDEIDRYMNKNEDLKASEADLVKQKQDLLTQIEDLKNKGYSETGETIQGVQEKVDGVNEKLDENKKKLAENEEAHRKWAAQTIFSFAQARAAADGSISEVEGKLLIDAGQALGLFDENTAKTMQNVNSAFDSLDTSNAQDVINTLVEQLEALTSEPWTITVGVEAEPLPTQPPPVGSTSPYASGGEVYAGSPVVVGEAGSESFIPSQNGRILGHAESLHALSMSGGSNYFYGNVTLQISEEAAGGLLEYR